MSELAAGLIVGRKDGVMRTVEVIDRDGRAVGMPVTDLSFEWKADGSLGKVQFTMFDMRVDFVDLP